MFRRIALIFALSLVSVFAFAMPKPSEVKAAFVAGNYIRAESLLKEVLTEHPTATVHYQLGQVYAKEGKHALALNEYRQAQALDPTLKFASSADTFIKALADEQAITTPGQVHQSVAPAAAHSTTNLALIFAIITGVIVLPVFFIFVFLPWRKKKEEEKLLASENKAKTATLLEFSKQLEDALLIAKSSSFDVSTKKVVTDGIISYQNIIRIMLAEIKDGKKISADRMATLETNVIRIVDSVANETSPYVTPAGVSNSQIRNDVSFGRFSEPQLRDHEYTVQPVRTVYGNYASPAPTPIIVNTSNNDMLTGMMIGSMINDHHDHTVYVDRHEFDAPRRSQDSYEGTHSSTLDTSSDVEEDSYCAPSRSSKLDTNTSKPDTYDEPSSSFSSMDSSSSDSSSSDSSSSDSSSSDSY